MKFSITMPLLVLFTACEMFMSKIDRALNSIDKGIATLATQSTSWENTINKIANDLPHEVHDLIGNDLKILANDIVGTTGGEFKCSIDFVRNRAIHTLQNLKLKLQGKPFKNLPPEFCTVNISSIDLNSDPISRNTLNIYGYDLYSQDTAKMQIKAALLGENIKMEINENYIGRVTNYQLSINLNALLPILIENKFDKIQTYWNGDTVRMPQILIQKWKAKTQIEAFTPQPSTFVPPFSGQGDRDFNTQSGNVTNGRIMVRFEKGKNSIDAFIFMDAMEFGGDNTRVGISIDPATNQVTERTAWSNPIRIYTVADNKYEIQDFSPNTSSELLIRIDSKGPKLYFMGGGSVSSYTVDLDHEGDDAGTYTRVEVAWNNFSVNLIEKK